MGADPALSPEVRAAWEAHTPAQTSRPSLNVARIVEAGLRVADAEGLGGLSMARIAQELGSATMALYRHVASKDALLVHLQDAGLGSPPPRPEPRPDWRTGLATWTTEILAVYLRRPWMLGIPVTTPPLMPRNLEWTDWAVDAMADMPLQPFEKLSTLVLLSGYARNEVTQRTTMTGAALDERADLSFEAGLRHLTSPERLPALHALATSGQLFAMPAAATSDDGDQFMVDFGLDRILDGIEALIATRGR